MGLDLTFIGTGNAFAPGGLCWNGFLANGRYLFEAPPQALMSLHHVAADPNEIEAVVLSHHHGDHFLGLPFLLLHWKYRGRTEPITIVGPPGTEQLATEIGRSVYPGLFEADYPIVWVVAEPGASLTVGDLALEPIGVVHDDRLSLNLGFDCRLDGVRFGYTGDSAMCDGVLDLARTSDVLVSECASRADRIPIHMNLVDDMPRLRAEMQPTARLVITHVNSDIEPADLANTVIARDYQTYRY